jgi:hypothetical protein
MAKIWMQGKERFMCPVCKNEEIELGQKYCQICGEPLEWKEDKQDHFVEANKTIGKDINAPTKWIPVEERLPEEDVIVLVTVSGFYSHFTFSNTIELGNLCSDGSWFIEGYPDWDNPEVTAWMPLPEPYQSEE